MGITVFGGEKGGTGKTTLATNIAAMLAKSGRDVREFVSQEKFSNLTLLQATVRDRISFRKSARDGLSVVEHRLDRKAATEMNELYEAIYGDEKNK